MLLQKQNAARRKHFGKSGARLSVARENRSARVSLMLLAFPQDGLSRHSKSWEYLVVEKTTGRTWALIPYFILSLIRSVSYQRRSLSRRSHRMYSCQNVTLEAFVNCFSFSHVVLLLAGLFVYCLFIFYIKKTFYWRHFVFPRVPKKGLELKNQHKPTECVLSMVQTRKKKKRDQRGT